ncbi:MAG: L-threonylcarbamoyladenylate synthase, partial [Chloroflexi bacterium]|nr:L-threonylcarbamoyladenylate synthase [Chloroflexota bacterium]
GLRMPAHPIPLAIIRELGEPLPTTSANLSGQPSPRTADDVLAQLREGYPLLIDGGACPGGVDSTVIDLTGTRPRLLRAGGLAPEQIEAILGPVERTA